MKPFLRWAGGKSWLLKHLRSDILESGIRGYHEPFLGGGAVFFSLGKTQRVHLSDVNPRLIETYQQVRDSVKNVTDHLKRFQNNRDFYNEIRSKQFADPSKRAAQFIYLNQTSFNGIYRENLRGEYNVPFGNRTKDFVQEKLLLEASTKLRGVNLRANQFDKFPQYIKKNDLVFLDPPYTITHNNNGFIKYNKHLFSLADQHRLALFIKRIIEKEAYYILTNAAHEEIEKIFRFNPPVELKRISHVGGEKKRVSYSEYLFTNLDHGIFDRVSNPGN